MKPSLFTNFRTHLSFHQFLMLKFDFEFHYFSISKTMKVFSKILLTQKLKKKDMLKQNCFNCVK